MARSARIVVPQLPYHVTQRGNRKQIVFFSDDDYLAYIELMSQSCRYFKLRVLAYCLMPNHVHIVCEPQHEKSLRMAIGNAHEQYSKQINFQNGWTGHLWQGRFFSAPMDEPYLAACVRYVELNPVRAGLCDHPAAYRWSSAQAHFTGQDDKLVKVQPMLERFPDWTEYLNTDMPPADLASIREHSLKGRPMGDDGFLEELESKTGRQFLKRKSKRNRKQEVQEVWDS
jgi:putative transposase